MWKFIGVGLSILGTCLSLVAIFMLDSDSEDVENTRERVTEAIRKDPSEDGPLARAYLSSLSADANHLASLKLVKEVVVFGYSLTLFGILLLVCISRNVKTSPHEHEAS